MRNRTIFSALVIAAILLVSLPGCNKNSKETELEKMTKQIEAETASGNAQGANAEYIRDVANMTLALKKNPKDSATMIKLGNTYLDNFEYKKAIAVYLEALKYKKKDVNVMTDIGAAYYRLGQLEPALKYFEKSVEIDPKHTQAWYNMGVIYHFKEDREHTIATWEKYLALETDAEKKSPIELEVARLKKGEPFLKPSDEESADSSGHSGGGETPMPSSNIIEGQTPGQP